MVDNKKDVPVSELEFLKATIAEAENKRVPWYDSFVFGMLVGLMLAAGILVYKETSRYANSSEIAVKHIQVVTATDKSCNDCHLGASFVNLFNHTAVKGNDNIVNLMMDKAKIKRW